MTERAVQAPQTVEATIWTPERDRQLYDGYVLVGPRAIAERWGVSVGAVRARAEALHLIPSAAAQAVDALAEEHRVWIAALARRPSAWRAWIAQRLGAFPADHPYHKSVGVTKARITEGRWEFAEDGAWSIVLPVYERDPALADTQNTPPALVDLAAWQPREHRIGTRLGLGVALGAWNLAAAAERGAFERLDIWATPGEWLERGSIGVFVLDWTAAAAALRRVRCPILAADLETAERIISARKRRRRAVAGVRVRAGVTA